MMEIRLIAADLDGTLLNEAGEVSELTQRVLLRAQRDGIRIVWATGRDLPHFATVREALHTDIFAQNFYIALNGALIVNCGIGAEQRTDGFAADNVDPFLQIADAYDLEALSYTRNGCFRYAQPGFEQLRFEYLKEHSLAIKDNVEHLFGGNIELPTPCYPSAAGTVQKVAYLHSSLRLQQLLPELRTKLPAGSKALMVTPCWLKIVPEWLNKGAALTKVMRECGIRPEETAAFGNGENDLGMLKSVTHGYAMGSKNQPGGINSSSANAASVSCFSFQWTERCAAFPDKECRTADRKGRGEASFKLLRPPQREGTNLRKFLPPLTRPQIACILCIMNNVHVEAIR